MDPERRKVAQSVRYGLTAELLDEVERLEAALGSQAAPGVRPEGGEPMQQPVRIVMGGVEPVEAEVLRWEVVRTGPRSIAAWYEAVVRGRTVRCAGEYRDPWRGEEDETPVRETVIVDGRVRTGRAPWRSAEVEEPGESTWPLNAENVAWELAAREGKMPPREE